MPKAGGKCSDGKKNFFCSEKNLFFRSGIFSESADGTFHCQYFSPIYLQLLRKTPTEQGCQMVYFQSKNPLLGKFVGPWNGKFWYILWSFGIFYGAFYDHLVMLR
jgi:hypothetical protein